MNDTMEKFYTGSSKKHLLKKVIKGRKRYGMESSLKIIGEGKTHKGKKFTTGGVEYPFEARSFQWNEKNDADTERMEHGNTREARKAFKAGGIKKEELKTWQERDKENAREQRVNSLYHPTTHQETLRRRKQMAKEASDSTFQFRKGQAEAAKSAYEVGKAKGFYRGYNVTKNKRTRKESDEALKKGYGRRYK